MSFRILAYARKTRTTLEEGIKIEQQYFRAFNSNSNLKDFESQRTAVMERGRSQTSMKR